MAAKFTIIKYTGKDSEFGTEVSSIGLKRIDAAVPAVYGNPVVPGDDASDVAVYSVHRPDDENGVSYSFESIFKLKLVEPPDNQLSNVRIYPIGEPPKNQNTPKLYIGCNSSGYTRPTNTKSLIAVHDIWSFNELNPFYVTVGGISGNQLNPQIPVQLYNITLGDIGYGNLIYINGERQPKIHIIKPRLNQQNKVYTFLDRTNNSIDFVFYNPVDNTVVSHPSIVNGIDGYGRKYVELTATPSLFSLYPNGLLYGSSNSIAIGGLIEWIDLDGDVILTETHVVEARQDMYGKYRYYIDNVRNPVLNFELNRKYVFNNISGDIHPIRFIKTKDSIANESNIVIQGVYVENGGTTNETITIDPRKVFDSGYKILSYQSVNGDNLGNIINNNQYNFSGFYNINTVGAGTNPSAAGETDFIYLQLEVKYNSVLGNVIPQLAIEYDEN